MKANISLTHVDSIKMELLTLLPEVKSSHRVEAMARGLGWNSNASLRAELAHASMLRSVDSQAFHGYLKEHGFPDARWDTLKEAVIRVGFPDARSAIERVMSGEPNLSANGFRYNDPTKLAQQEEADFHAHRAEMVSTQCVGQFLLACEYLELMERRETVNKNIDSYAWKHRAEEFFRSHDEKDSYVGNGMFIAAALHLGFIVQQNRGTPNAFINIVSEHRPKRDNGSSKLAKFAGGPQRTAAWENMMVAAINAGLEQGLFGLEVDDNRWEDTQGVYRFDFAGMPAIAYVGDAGYGELSIHVAVRPTEEAERAVRAFNAGFYAGDAFASGWFEREKGKWIQSSGQPTTAFRRELLPIIANAVVEPNGFSRSGRFMM